MPTRVGPSCCYNGCCMLNSLKTGEDYHKTALTVDLTKSVLTKVRLVYTILPFNQVVS